MSDKLSDFPVTFHNRSYAPLMVGGMGVNISTAELALAVEKLGGIGHVSDALMMEVADKRFGTNLCKEKIHRYKDLADSFDKSAVQFDLERVAEATKRYVEDVMSRKSGNGLIFINCMEKLTMNSAQDTLRTRLNAALDGGIDGITLSAGLHMSSMKLMQDNPRFREALIGIIVSSTRALQIFMKRAAALTQARRKAAAALSQAVTEQMQHLAMTGGRLEINLPSCEPWAGGLERCEFLVSGHAGATPRPLTKVASGGELARISLAIAVITAQITPVPTLIFDEVDSGIGGAVAEVVGRLLRRLGATRQVLCVTHLPQVAACAHHQWLVHKESHDNVTTSSLKPLGAQERIREIARMAGGLQITDATLKAAQELIESAEKADAAAPAPLPAAD